MGNRRFTALLPLETVLRRRAPTHFETQQVLEALRVEFPADQYIQRQVSKKLDYATANRARAAQNKLGSTVKPSLHTHFIPSLAPAASWTLQVDEGGAFAPIVADEAHCPSRVVGVLIPEKLRVPAVPAGWHAVEQKDLGEIDRVVQVILDRPVGILGLRTDALVDSLGDVWLAAVLELIAWTVRLLPLDGPTTLDVQVEQRGGHVAGTRWHAGAVAVRRLLAEVAPERAAAISLTLRLIGKHDSPHNGYVDALAFTWTSPTRPSAARLNQSGLRGTCLIEATGESAALIRDAIVSPDALPPQTWASLVALPDAAEEHSLVSFLLARAASACRVTPLLWSSYFALTERHLESKAIGLATLGRQVEFLMNCAPPETELAPTMRLAWAVARLEMANHTGAVATHLADEISNLGDTLFDEEPTLVCQADLVVAVLNTNAFKFEDAASAIRRWRDQPVAVPGRRHWGRLESTRGQHAAFRGELRTAISHFRAAIVAFSKLSDRRIAASERAQTQTYLAIAAMDGGAESMAAVRAEVGHVASLAKGEIRRLARSSKPGEKYAHHLLVRFLYQDGTPDERRNYLEAAGAAHWPTDTGHPWQLIEAYRGALLVECGDLEAAQERFCNAADLALSGGLALQYIAITLSIFGARALNEPVPPFLDEDAAKALRSALPDAPWDILERAEELSPSAFLRAALPFNFR